MVRSKDRGIGDIIIGTTVTVLFVVILSLVVFAARGYQFSVSTQDDNGNTRAVVSYVISCVRDASGTVSIEDRDGTECLIIPGGSSYERRLYQHDGSLMEEFVEKSAPLDPSTALSIGSAGIFDLELGDNGLLSITTDHGSAYVNTAHR